MDIFDRFVEFAISRWKDKGTISDEETTREYIEMMVSLLLNYRFKCLVSTLIEVDDMMEEFDEILNEEEKNTEETNENQRTT